MIKIKIFCLLILLFSFVVHGMEHVADQEMDRVVVTDNSSSERESGIKKVETESIRKVIRIKSNKIPKNKVNIPALPKLPTTIPKGTTTYTPRELGVIQGSLYKYNLTEEKLELLEQLKKEYELNDEGLLEVMKKNINADGTKTKSWELERLQEKMRKDAELREALQVKALIKLIHQLDIEQEIAEQPTTADQTNNVSMKRIYTDMAYEEIEEKEGWLHRAGFAILGLGITAIGEFVGLFIPLLVAKVGPVANCTG